MDPRLLQLLQVAAREGMASDPIEQEVDANSTPRCFCEMLLEPTTDSVVVDDVELRQDVVTGSRDALEQCCESVGAVDQQAGFRCRV